jgi:hypothetical protein
MMDEILNLVKINERGYRVGANTPILSRISTGQYLYVLKAEGLYRIDDKYRVIEMMQVFPEPDDRARIRLRDDGQLLVLVGKKRFLYDPKRGMFTQE